MGPSHLGVYLCKAENEIGGDQGGVTLTGETLSERLDNYSLWSNQYVSINRICQDVKIIQPTKIKFFRFFFMKTSPMQKIS